MFNYVDVELPKLNRETLDNVRYYTVPGDGEPVKLVSITSVTSFYNRQVFADWRKKVGEEEANKVTKAATRRGTDMHTLAENYLKNEQLPKVGVLPEYLFKQAKPYLDKIDNIHALEDSLYSVQLGVAGTVDCIAEYDGELAVIDFKTSKKPKPIEWIENYFVQAAAYACMFYELTGIAVDKLVILMSCENGEVEVYEIKGEDKLPYIKLLLKYIRNFVEHKLTEYGT
jgi:CRISPR/Cas system-associated exonuclease Cas4 (RecB family)